MQVVFSMVLPDVKAINYLKRNFEIRVAFWKEGIESYIRHIDSCLGPSINEVSGCSGFLTPPFPMSAIFFSTIHREFLTAPPLPIANVVYGQPLFGKLGIYVLSSNTFPLIYRIEK